MGYSDKEIASTTVTTDEDGTITATATTKDGSTGSGTSSEGLVSAADPEEAVKEAVKKAQAETKS